MPGMCRVPPTSPKKGENYSNCRFEEIEPQVWIETHSKIKVFDHGKVPTRKQAIDKCLTHTISWGCSAKATGTSMKYVEESMKYVEEEVEKLKAGASGVSALERQSSSRRVAGSTVGLQTGASAHHAHLVRHHQIRGIVEEPCGS